MPQNSEKDICQRIAKVRLEQDGPRGKSRFAKKLGISPSTYDYYESSRVPSAELLVKITEITHVDLRWLLTGEVGDEGCAVPLHPAVRRAAEMLDHYPDAAKPLAAFLDILAGTFAFPVAGENSPANQNTTADSGVVLRDDLTSEFPPQVSPQCASYSPANDSPANPNND